MLTLTLKNFRCYNNLILQIPIGQTTLIKGSSGSGKTTLLKAITWALYGISKKKLITPFTAASNVKTIVTIQFNKIKIIRCLPKKLELIYHDKKYVDIDAQHQINNMFGDYDVWLSTSYVAQKKDNYFLSASNADKINILNSIAFRDSNPSDYLDKIGKYIDKTKTIQQYKLTQYNKHLKNFKDDDINILSDVEEDNIIKDLKTLNTQLLNLTKLKQKYDIDVAIKQNKQLDLTKNLKLLSQLQPLQHNINIDLYPNQKVQDILLSCTINQDDLLILQNAVVYLTDINNKIILKQQLEEKLKQFGFDNVSHFYTLTDLQDITKAEALYQQNDLILKKYELEHNKEDIQEYIHYCQDLLNDQKVYDCQQCLQTLTTTKEQLTKNIADLNQQIKYSHNYIISVDMSLYDNIHCHNKITELLLSNNNLQQKLHESKNHIQCPHCHQEVMYKNGALIKLTHIDDNIDLIEKQMNKNNHDINILQDKIQSLKEDEVKTKKELDKQQNLYNQLIYNKQQKEEELLTIHQQIKDKNEVLNLLPPLNYDNQLTVKERENIYKCIHELKTVIVVAKPNVTSSHIKDYLNYQEYKNKYLELLETIPANINIPLTCYVEELKDYVKQCQTYLTQKTMLDHTIQHLSDQIEQIIILPDPEQDVIDVKNKIKYLEDILNKNKLANIKLKEKEKLNEERDEVCQLSQKVDDSTELKQRALAIECAVLDDIVKQINTNVDEVCSQLFDQDIKIELSLFKTLKVSSKVKQAVTFNMFYKNGVYDNISESSSGGESSRLSISLTLALNRLFNHKLILFDEATESLDVELKNRVVKTIMEQGGTAIVVQHEGVEGVFDHVIDVDLLVK
jgi:DNA repair exonuclease SbcCD ATPase subunit